MSTPRPDDASIPDGEWLFRRVPDSQAPFDSNRGQRWPSSAAMMPTTGEHDISVYLDGVLAELRLTPETVLEKHADHWLARLTAAAGRAETLGVVRDPVDEPDPERRLRCDPAHGLLHGLPPATKARRRIARALVYDHDLEWVLAPGSNGDPDEGSNSIA